MSPNIQPLVPVVEDKNIIFPPRAITWWALNHHGSHDAKRLLSLVVFQIRSLYQIGNPPTENSIAKRTTGQESRRREEPKLLDVCH